MDSFLVTCDFDGCVRTLRLRSDRAQRWGKYPAEVEMGSRGRINSVDHSSTKGSDTPWIICSSSEPSSADESKPNILVRRGLGPVLVVTAVSGAIEVFYLTSTL